MLELHNKILTLIKEIDFICQKYNIHYYTAGGTTIGAVRHHGFIPWDDDIDIYMTRSEFYRFREAFKIEKPEGRALECLDDNKEYPGTIPRYIDTTTTDLCRFHCLNTCAGGIIIDIFILDPIPSNPDLQNEYRAKLNVYADFTMPYYAFSYRNDTAYLDLYLQYKKKEEKNGREAVLKELEKDLFTYPEEEADFYMLRWATLPSIFSKSMFDKPSYFPFEDMKLPLPSDWYGYLNQLYGADWMYIPQNVENQVQHIAVINTEISYLNYTRELDEFINKEEALSIYEKRKLNLLEKEKLDRPFREKVLMLKAQAISESVKEVLRKSTDTLEEMWEAKKYRQILELFDKYLLEQLSPVYAGRMKHGDWYRLKNPIFIYIDDKKLFILIYSLLSIGEIKKAERLLQIRKSSEHAETEMLVKITTLVNKLGRLRQRFYLDDYEGVKALLREFSEEESQLLPVVQIKYLSEASNNDSVKFQKELEEIMQSYPESLELKKAYGDYWYAKGEVERAKNEYAVVLGNLNNGIMQLDIIRKVGNIKEQCLSTVISKYGIGEKYSKEWRRKQFELLKELHEICENNDIQYSLANYTAVYAYYNNCLPANRYVNSVIMTAENAAKFVKVVSAAKRPERELDYMGNNSAHIGDDIYYGDLSAAYVNLNTLYYMKSMGMFIRIIVLRAANRSKISNAVTYTLEAIRTANCNVDKIHKSIFRKVVRCGSDTMTQIIGADTLSKIVFDRMIKDEQKSVRDQYFIAERKRLRKNILAAYPSAFFKDVKKVLVKEQGQVQQFNIIGQTEEYLKTVNDNFEPDLFEDNLQNGVWMYSDPDLSAENLKCIINWNVIKDSKEWKDHIEAKRYLRRIKTGNIKIASYWKVILRADDRMKMWRYYQDKQEEIIKAFEEKKYKLLDDYFEELDQKVVEYAKEHMGFYFESRVFKLYYEWLNIRGRGKEANYYRELVPEYYFKPLEITD